MINAPQENNQGNNVSGPNVFRLPNFVQNSNIQNRNPNSNLVPDQGRVGALGENINNILPITDFTNSTEAGIKYEAKIDPLTTSSQSTPSTVQVVAGLDEVSTTQRSSSSTTQATPVSQTKTTIKDIEARFIAKAKKIIEATKNDPYEQENQVADLQKIYQQSKK